MLTVFILLEFKETVDRPCIYGVYKHKYGAMRAKGRLDKRESIGYTYIVLEHQVQE